MRNSWVLLAFLCACSSEKPITKKAEAPVRKPAPPEFRVKFETTKGGIVIEVKQEWAPRGAVHFYDLVQAGFYDGVKFHRVRDGFIAQFGINGDPAIEQMYGAMRIQDDPVKLKNKKGTIAYAKAGPNSRTTEVFFNLKDNPELEATGFAAFGRVVEGMDAVEQISSWYGELAPRGRGPDPILAQQKGNKYLEEKFPKLDGIKRAIIVE